MLVTSLASLAVFITEMSPPLVTIKSAKGENVEALQGIIERATATQTMH